MTTAFELFAHAPYDLPQGQGSSNALFKGTRIATTYTRDTACDRYVQLGLPVQQPDYEYELYRLSAQEFVQLLPEHAVRTQQHLGRTQVLWEAVPTLNANVARNPVLRDHRVPLNKAMRKYGIDTPMRQACFFGNAV